MNPRHTWPALAFGLLGLSLLMSGAGFARWDWQPALAWREPWRAWSAAVLHWSTLHLAMNGAGAVLLGWLGWRAGAGARDTLAWFMAWPLTQFGLLLQPALRHYAGLSGVLHAGVAVLLWRLLASGPGRPRQVGWLLGAGLALKLASEAPWRDAVRAMPGWDFALAPAAHLSGTLAGLGCAALLAGAQRLLGHRAGRP